MSLRLLIAILKFLQEFFVKDRSAFPALRMCAYNYDPLLRNGMSYDEVSVDLLEEVVEAGRFFKWMVTGNRMWERRGMWQYSYVADDVVAWMSART